MSILRQLFPGFRKAPKGAVVQQPDAAAKTTQSVYYTVSTEGELIALNTQEIASVKVAEETARRDLLEQSHES